MERPLRERTSAALPAIGGAVAMDAVHLHGRIADGEEITQPSVSGRLMEGPAWSYEWQTAVGELEAMAARVRDKPPPAVRVLRVNQLDAARLDVELTDMLREQFMRVFSMFRPGVIARWQPELTAVLEFLIFRFSIWADRPTPGNALMNLRYRNERAVERLSSAPAKSAASAAASLPAGSQPFSKAALRSGVEGPGLSRAQRMWFGLATVGLRYAWQRFSRFSTSTSLRPTNASSAPRYNLQSSLSASSSSSAAHGTDSALFTSRTFWLALNRVEAAVKLASLLNHFVFLYDGKYPGLVERIIGARLVYNRPTMSRAVSFEYMNRQLVWQELSELLLFVLPLVNVGRLRRQLADWMRPLSSPASSPYSSSSSSTSCPVCYADPINTPFVAVPCEHAFCYYCIRSNCLARPNFRCPRCKMQVTAIRRLSSTGYTAVAQLRRHTRRNSKKA